MNKFAFLCCAVLLSSPAVAGKPPRYELINEKSSLKFVAIQNNAPLEGEFKEFSAYIALDPDNLKESKISVEVMVNSLSASYQEVVTNLKLPEWFFVEKYNKAVFTSETITRMPMTDNYIIDGSLLIRDKAIPTTLNAQIQFVDGTNAIAKGHTTIHRRKFGIGQGQWDKDDIIKDEVRIEFRVVAVRK